VNDSNQCDDADDEEDDDIVLLLRFLLNDSSSEEKLSCPTSSLLAFLRCNFSISGEPDGRAEVFVTF